ncbi:Rec8p RNJ42_03702 [Nakaseomyces bracarensis]|uniref:Rec8p n=1 Tax=Nakaseomyces bracarensis TaxID=273131 RepID=UPI00387270CF
MFDAVAKVWLLGALSGRDSVKKKDILVISIPRTCDAISSNELSLRQVSQLLFGVAICYQKKTEFVLNDVEAMLVQLQKRILCGARRDVRSGPHDMQVISLDSKKLFLRDDPLFKIDKVRPFVLEQDPFVVAQAQSIRKQDYLNELGVLPLQHSGKMRSRLWNRPYTVEIDETDELPIDETFHLDIEDILSPAILTNDTTVNNDINFELDPGTHEHRGKRTSLDFGRIIEEEEEEEEDDGLDDESTSFVEGPSPKRQKRNTSTIKPLIPKIKCDERISIPNEQLRSNQENYLARMETSEDKRFSDTGHFSIKQLSESALLDFSVVHLSIAKLTTKRSPAVINKQRVIDGLEALFNTPDDIERGRRRTSEMNSLSSRSHSSLSEELGRRLNYQKVFDDNSSDQEFSTITNNNLMLNLEQINEELDENEDQSVIDDFRNQNLMELDLQLTSSSTGRHASRSSSLRDIVDVLRTTDGGRYKRSRIHTSDSEIIEENDNRLSDDYIPTSTTNKAAIVDQQNRRFHDYLRERVMDIGEDSRRNDFTKKVLLEDIIPSKVSNIYRQEQDVVSKAVAANVFFSLLTLATQNTIALKERQQETRNLKTDLMTSECIIVYV